MSKNITYLLGAGASFHSIPIVSTMNERMLLFLNMLERYKIYDNESMGERVQISSHIDFPDYYNGLNSTSFGKYKEVVNEAFKHHTVDTYARKLWLRRQRGHLKLLKEFLCLYFAFEQSPNADKLLYGAPDDHENVGPYIKHQDHINESLDYRYDVFMATLLNEHMRLPENISIISWNYDYQIELAYMSYADCSMKEAIGRLSLYPGLSEIDKARVIKLNGSAIQRGLKEKGEWISWDICPHNDDDFYRAALNDAFDSSPNSERARSENLINFAWEDRLYQARAIERAKEIISNTHELIVIGYSFPNFNKKIDAQIFSGIKKIHYKIKVQCGIDDYHSIDENIKTLGSFMPNADIEYIKNIDQFYIPAYQLIEA
jgi:hypothetical protein